MSPEVPPTAAVYERLGLSRVVNAADTYTALGGGRLSPDVLAAISDASSHHVDMEPLLAAVGRRIAELVGVPACLPVSGAAAGLVVAAAACLTGGQARAVGRLPATVGLRDEILALTAQRNGYDGALAEAGATIRSIGHADTPPAWSLGDEIDERTAAVVYFAGDEFEDRAPSLREVVAAVDRRVPLIVDAAAQVPPYRNLSRYHEEGADLVVVSGGKGLRGPQASGLVLGDAELIEACRANAFPRHSVGRPMKLSKEIALGLLAAVEEALSSDPAIAERRWRALLDRCAQAVERIDRITLRTVDTGRMGQACPRLYLSWTAGSGPTAGELAKSFRALTVPVAIGLDRARAHEVFVNPFSVLPEEEDYLVDVVGEVMRMKFGADDGGGR